MSQQKPFAPDDAQQKEYEREARLQYDPDTVAESHRRWNDYTQSQRDFIMEEGNVIYADLADALKRGVDPLDDEVQTTLTRWHDHIRHFYEPTIDTLAGLGQLYVDDARFRANFEKLHPALPEFLQTAITKYADDLETAAIEALLETDDTDDDERQQRLSK